MKPQYIFRVQKEKNFTVISNHPINDTSLSPEALGVLVYLLSKPDDWQVFNGEVQRRFSMGRKKLDRIVDELKAAGYVQRQRQRDDTGTFYYETIIQEVPLEARVNRSTKRGQRLKQTVVPLSVNGSSVNGSSVNGKGDNILSTDLPNTNQPNTENNNNNTVAAVVFSLLNDLEIYSPTREELAKLPHVSETYIRGWIIFKEKSPKSPTGWIINQIRAGAAPPAHKQPKSGRAIPAYTPEEQARLKRMVSALQQTGEDLDDEPTFDPYTGQVCPSVNAERNRQIVVALDACRKDPSIITPERAAKLARLRR